MATQGVVRYPVAAASLLSLLAGQQAKARQGTPTAYTCSARTSGSCPARQTVSRRRKVRRKGKKERSERGPIGQQPVPLAGREGAGGTGGPRPRPASMPICRSRRGPFVHAADDAGPERERVLLLDRSHQRVKLPHGGAWPQHTPPEEAEQTITLRLGRSRAAL